MRISIDEHYSFFEWEFSFDGKIDTFKEQFTGKFWDSSLYYGFGEILANLMWVQSITQSQERNIKTMDFSPLKNFVLFADDGKELDSATVVYEALAKLAFVIYNQTAYCIKCIRDNKYRNSKIFKKLYSFMCMCTGHVENNANNFNPNICMEYMFDALKKLNRLINCEFLAYNHGEIITNLINIINEYSNDDSKTAELMSCYQFEYSQRRCVAAYIFFNPQIYNNNIIKGYIAFSGYNDCESIELYESINKDKNEISFPFEFLNKIKEIARTMQMKLITTNEDIQVHKVDYSTNEICVYTTLKNEITKGNRGSELRKYFSCCERKIFTEFYNTNPTFISDKFGYYHGTLHVKFPPCELCDLSVLYEWKQNHKFDVIWYIKKL